jgi:hypothetical protein
LAYPIADRVWFAVPEPTEWQRIGNQINAALVFAWSDFVNVHRIFFTMLQRDGATALRFRREVDGERICLESGAAERNAFRSAQKQLCSLRDQTAVARILILAVIRAGLAAG